MANFYANYPVTGSSGGANASVGPNGAPIPMSATLVAGENPSGNLQPLQTDSSGNLYVNINGGLANPLPVSDATTHTELMTINTTLGSPFQAGGSIGNTTFGATQPTASLLNATVVAPGGAALALDSSLTTINTTLGSPFQAGGSIGNTTFAATQATASLLNATVVGLGTAGTPSGGVLSIQGVAGGTPVPTTGTSTVSGTVTANQGTPNTLANAWPEVITDGTNGPAAVKPASTAAIATDPALVVAISPNNTVATTNGGNVPLQFVRNVYSSTNVTTGAYVQLIASTSGVTNVIETFDSSGQTLAIAFGAMGSEVQQFLIFPGGNGRATCAIPSGTRVSIIAISATASSGEFDLNLYT